MITLAAPVEIDQQAIAENPKHFFQEILESACSATRDFLRQCKNIWEAKQLPKGEWNEIKQLLGWNSHTANPYVKIWQWISDLKINSYNLELLDINTIKSLCSDRYLEVWHQLQSSRMVVEDVRSLMADINKSLKKPTEPPKVFEYQQSKYGEDGDGRVIIRLEDAATGVELERQFKQSGKPSLAMFFKELLRRPTVDEQVLAQQELDAYIDEQQPELPPDVQAEIAKEDRIRELTVELRQVSQALADFKSAGYREDTCPLAVVVDRKSTILRELLLCGVVPDERSYSMRE